MAEVPLERRFQGGVRLVTLHLWKVARSTDLDEGFAEARRLGMLDGANEGFLRRCFAAADQLAAGADPQLEITSAVVDELQRCALRLNAADPA